MKRAPPPAVGDDLAAVQQQPAQDLGVAPAGREVHGRGPVAVAVRQADLRKAHLRTEVRDITAALGGRLAQVVGRSRVREWRFPANGTHQPDDDRVVAHLRSSVERRHPVIGSDAGICLAVLEQVLDDLQVAFLTGQVERRGTILGLRVDEAAGRERKLGHGIKPAGVKEMKVGSLIWT